ncbi:glycine--tRNA ligase subunit beta [Thiolapillus sp.]|uniref:glycine--tRNA ligase subunit beta n=1 Tax=Thiolapillus sp. TaxID=2017437 RepID=UPI003AF47F3D
MTDNRHLLFELGCEELPPKSLLKLSNALLENIRNGLDKADLDHGNCQAYATPRRLAVLVEDLSPAQPDRSIQKRGPALQAAFDADGKPSKAAEGFARSCGVTVEQLQRISTDKGQWLAFTQEIKGQSATELLPDIIRHSIHTLPIAKRMRWGSSSSEFVRPVHWVLLLYGGAVIDTKILGLTTDRYTQGHRFHAPERIALQDATHYEQKLLQEGKVIVDFAGRQAQIRAAAEEAAIAVGGTAHIEADLLEEVAALNEWPVAVTGNFHRRFLDLPDEVLISTMQTNQKYFPVKGPDSRLLPHFITFTNIESTRPESVREGNERVIAPRLADAEFFWNQDRKRRLDERVLDLANIIFQNKLGSLADKARRLEQLVEYIAQTLQIDPELPKRAALLAKTDLLTEMVGEFPSLQGVMGRYYAAADGERPEVAAALEEQYFPKQSGSPTPGHATGQILSMADKIDTLTGIFSAGLIPSGDKDPYALRRAAFGTLRILIENDLDLDLVAAIDFALQQYTHSFDRQETRSQVIDFVFDRLKSYCLEQGYSANEFASVLQVKPGNPLDFMARLQAVKVFSQLPEAESLASANKRIRNILRKSETEPATEIGALSEPQEQQLLASAQQAQRDIQPLLEQRDYQAALTRLARLQGDVDAFFDHVMVMTDDLQLRARRLALLTLLADLFLQIADISRLSS